MQRKTLRNRFLMTVIAAILLATASQPAHAASKEIIELQTQVQQLLDMVQRLQSTLDTRFAVLQHLAEQTADNANQMTTTVNSLQQKLAAQTEATNGKQDAISGQMQSLNDSVDELKSRIAKLDKSVQDMQTQLQNAQPPPQTPAATTPAPGAPGEAAAGTMPSMQAIPAGNQPPPLQESFQAAMRDFNAAKLDVASGEFQDVVHYYPMDDLAGQSQFYLGEIAYRHQKFTDAVKNYNAVLESFPGNSKAPAAQLHKALALLQMNKRDAGIHELKLLIQRHPQSPEAAQAHAKLAVLSVVKTGTH
jgi:TolA-binding protein